MGKKRRVELHIEHREISIYAPRGLPLGPPINPSKAHAGSLLQLGPPACPACGSVDLQPLTDVVAQTHLDLAMLNHGMQNGSIHFHRSPSGEWWVCSSSIKAERELQGNQEALS